MTFIIACEISEILSIEVEYGFTPKRNQQNWTTKYDVVENKVSGYDSFKNIALIEILRLLNLI